MKKCIICGERATHTANVGLMLEHWENRWKSAANVGLCAAHVKEAQPVIVIDVIRQPIPLLVQSADFAAIN